MKKVMYLFTCFLLIASLFSGCSNSNPSESNEKSISIGSKNFTEAILIGEMYAQILEENDFNVERKFNLGATNIAHEAIVKGDIDLYPDYTSTCLITVLKQEPISDNEEVLKIIREKYEEDYDLKILDPSPMNNMQAIGVTKEIAEKFNLKTLSDLSKAASKIKLGCPPEFFQRTDGLKGLQKVYGGFEFKEAKSYDIALRYKALINKDIDSTVVFTTDGQISKYELVVLEDDKHIWPEYYAVPIIRNDTLEKYPEIDKILKDLNACLTDDEMQRLNWEIDGNKKEFNDVAKEFLLKNSLIDED